MDLSQDMTPHSMGFTDVEFSAINDKTDIWKQIYTDVDIKIVIPNKITLKKYMPELKNY